MSSRGLRPFSAVVLIFLFSILSATAAFANTTSKSVNTTTGECTGGGCGSLVYGSNGVSGRLWGTGSASLFDYLCVHKPSDGAPDSFGGTYTLTVTSGASTLASTSYTVVGGRDCTGDHNAAAGAPATFTYPASGFVTYSVSVLGVTSGNAQATFSKYNSVLNRVVDAEDDRGHANSPSVAPPGPTGEVPEVPAAALLILTGGLGAGWFLLRRRTDDSSISTS